MVCIIARMIRTALQKDWTLPANARSNTGGIYRYVRGTVSLIHTPLVKGMVSYATAIWTSSLTIKPNLVGDHSSGSGLYHLELSLGSYCWVSEHSWSTSVAYNHDNWVCIKCQLHWQGHCRQWARLHDTNVQSSDLMHLCAWECVCCTSKCYPCIQAGTVRV